MVTVISSRTQRIQQEHLKNLLHGIRLETVKLISDCSMPIIEKLINGLNADGQRLVMHHSSTILPTLLNGMMFATLLKHLNTLNLVISSLLCASNGLIWWFARLEISHFHNKAWSITSVTSVSSSRLPSSLASAMYHHSMLHSEPEWLLSPTLLSHHSPSSLLSSSMMKWGRFGCGMAWCVKTVGWNWKVGSSKIHITELNKSYITH